MRRLIPFVSTIQGLHAQMRLGEFSGSPVRLIRFALEDYRAECDWLMRPIRISDESLPSQVREQYASTQALCDAMTIRQMLFDLLPEVRIAEIRAFRFRESAHEPSSLVIAGTVTRQKPAIARVTSPAARAKLCGFDFGLDNGVLVVLEAEDLKDFHPLQLNSRRPCEVEEAMSYGGK